MSLKREDNTVDLMSMTGPPGECWHLHHSNNPVQV